MTGSVDVSGIGLSRAYWRHVVRRPLDEAMPLVPRAAAPIGTGPDVLGLEDAMSRDHDWGLRLQLIVPTAQRVSGAWQSVTMQATPDGLNVTVVGSRPGAETVDAKVTT